MGLLPAGYKRLEYIESNGNQHIDSGFKPNNNTRVVMDVAIDGDGTMHSLFGARKSATSNNYAMMFTEGAFRSDYNNVYTQTWSVEKKTRRIIDKNKETTTIDGDSKSYTNATFQAPVNLTLLANNNNGTVQWNAVAKLYSCQIYDNGTLVRNFLPCENASGAVGLYDTVGGAFYANDGTGTFVAGPEWSYVKLEYIESTGEQYVDSRFTPNQDTRVYVEAVLPIASSTQALFGVRVSSSARQFQFVTQGGYYRTDYNTAINSFSQHDYGASKFYLDKNKNHTDLNGEYFSDHTYAAFTCPGSMYIFATNNNGALYAQATAKLYCMEVYDNGNLVRDYIPVKLYDGSVGLLDVLTEVFYGNAGTGVFIAGPEVEIPPAQQIPPTPQNLHVSYAYGSSVRIEWEEAVDAEYYNVYRDGVLVSQVTTTSYTDSGLAEHAEHTYAVSAANSLGESESTSITAILTEFKLITDRSAADVQYVSGLALKAHKMTDAELSAWISGLKGAYNASDLNRVEGAVLYVVERLRIAGWYVKLDTKTDWKFSDFPTVAEMDRYLSNIRKLRAALPDGLPVVPADADRFTYSEANDIEKLLESLDAAVINIMANVFYSNELYSGEVQ